RAALAGGPADHLAEDETERVRVIRHLRSRLPPRLAVGDPRADPVPVADVLDGGVGADSGHPDVVGQSLPYGRVLLAVRTELRPQLYDPGVVPELAALDQPVHDRGGHGLAHR